MRSSRRPFAVSKSYSENEGELPLRKVKECSKLSSTYSKTEMTQKTKEKMG